MKFSTKSIFISVLASLLIISTIAPSASASAKENYSIVEANKIIEENNLQQVDLDETTVQEVLDKYDVKDVTFKDVPANAQVIKFDSEEELAIFLETLNTDTSYEEFDITPRFSTLGTATVTRKKAVEKIGVFGDINIEADFHLSGSGSFYSITAVKNIRTYASGFIWPFDWSQTGTPYGKIASNKQSATAYASGVVEYWALIQGVMKVYQRSVNLSVTYSTGR